MALNLKEYIYDKYLSKIRFCFVLCIHWLVIDLCWFGILYWFIVNFGFWRVFHGFVVNPTWLGSIFFCLSLWGRFDFVVWLWCVFFCLSFGSWFVIYLAWFGSVLFFQWPWELVCMFSLVCKMTLGPCRLVHKAWLLPHKSQWPGNLLY